MSDEISSVEGSSISDRLSKSYKVVESKEEVIIPKVSSNSNIFISYLLKENKFLVNRSIEREANSLKKSFDKDIESKHITEIIKSLTIVSEKDKKEYISLLKKNSDVLEKFIVEELSPLVLSFNNAIENSKSYLSQCLDIENFSIDYKRIETSLTRGAEIKFVIKIAELLDIPKELLLGKLNNDITINEIHSILKDYKPKGGKKDE